jgi:hypothetical protein
VPYTIYVEGCLDPAQIDAYLTKSDLVTEMERRSMDKHIAGCTSCSRQLEEMEDMDLLGDPADIG